MFKRLLITYLVLASACLGTVSSTAQTVSTNNVRFNAASVGLQTNIVTGITVTAQYWFVGNGFFYPNDPITHGRARYPETTNGYAIFTNLLCGVPYQVVISTFYNNYTTNFLIPANINPDTNGIINAASWVGVYHAPNQFFWSSPAVTNYNITIGGSTNSLTPWTSDINAGGNSLTNANIVNGSDIRQNSTNLYALFISGTNALRIYIDAQVQASTNGIGIGSGKMAFRSTNDFQLASANLSGWALEPTNSFVNTNFLVAWNLFTNGTSAFPLNLLLATGLPESGVTGLGADLSARLLTSTYNAAWGALPTNIFSGYYLASNPSGYQTAANVQSALSAGTVRVAFATNAAALGDGTTNTWARTVNGTPSLSSDVLLNQDSANNTGMEILFTVAPNDGIVVVSNIYLDDGGALYSSHGFSGPSQLTNSTTALPANPNALISSAQAAQVIPNSQTTKLACQWATTTALPANVYNNGTLGVGATLTGVSFGSLTVDGNTPNAGDRILVKNEATPADNGSYTLTVQGAVATLYVLTRGQEFNSSSNINEGDSFPVTGGTVNTNTTWELGDTTNEPVIVGTTALNFFQSSFALPDPLNVQTLNVRTVTVTNSLAVSNTVYSVHFSGFGISPTITTNVTWWTNINSSTGITNNNASATHSGDSVALSGTPHDSSGQFVVKTTSGAGLAAALPVATLVFNQVYTNPPIVIICQAANTNLVTSTTQFLIVHDTTVSNALFNSSSSGQAANSAIWYNYWIIQQ